MTEILIVGFPKSGNTWLSRLLADALDWPVRGINDARPLAECGKDHPAGHVIRQLHLMPIASDGPALADPWSFNISAMSDDYKIVHILRDPRDVAVAINHYWGICDLQRTINQVMVSGVHPLWGCGWAQYVDAWRKLPQVLETRYCWLHEDTLLELCRILDRLGLRAVKPLGEVIDRQQIDHKRNEITTDKDENYAHGKGPQLNNLRAGRVGDWRREFGQSERERFAALFNDRLIALGYESDPDWAIEGKIQTC